MTTMRTLWALALVLFAMVPRANAQIVWTNSSASSPWQTANNWSGNSVPTATSIAQFGANPTGTGGVGINFATTTNAGVQVNGQRIQEVGAVEVTSARLHSFLIGNSSTTTGANGQFRLNGSTVNGVANSNGSPVGGAPSAPKPPVPPAGSGDIHVIGRQVDTAVAKDWPGHKILDIPDWTLAKNDAWIQAIIDKKGRVYLGTPTNRSTLWDAVNGRETVLAREIRQLEAAGYKRVGDWFVPPGSP